MRTKAPPRLLPYSAFLPCQCCAWSSENIIWYLFLWKEGKCLWAVGLVECLKTAAGKTYPFTHPLNIDGWFITTELFKMNRYSKYTCLFNWTDIHTWPNLYLELYGGILGLIETVVAEANKLRFILISSNRRMYLYGGTLDKEGIRSVEVKETQKKHFPEKMPYGLDGDWLTFLRSRL